MSQSLEDQIDAAFEKHQGGELVEARALYEQILTQSPDSVDALHFLGVLNHQERNHLEAVKLISRAIELDPEPVEFHINLAEAYKSFGETDKAIDSYQQSIIRDPTILATWQNLGLLLQIRRRVDEAANAWRQALHLNPGLAETHNNYGLALQTLGQLREAARQYEAALAIKPSMIQAIENLTIVSIMLGNQDRAVQTAQTLVEHLEGKASAYVFLAAALNDVGRYHDAIDACRDALKVDPDCVNAHFNMGKAMAGLGEPRGAAIAYARAAETDPESAYAQIKLGLAALDTGNIEISSKCFKRTTELAPDMPEGWYNLGVSFERLGDLDRAMEMALRAVAVRPSMVEGITMLGILHLRKGNFDQSEIELRRAIEIMPTHAPAIAALANLYVDRGDHAEAQVLAQRAVDAAPHDLKAFDVLLMTLISDYRHSPADVFRSHQRYGQRFRPHTPPDVKSERLDRHRKLKIGYVSPDFRAHSVAYFFSGLIRHHDHENFEIFCYDDSLKPDAVTASIKSCADRFYRVAGISHESLAQQIRDDEIDILVDLAGHTADNRLPMFAIKPAPIQFSYLGYPGTSGVAAIDYRLTDEFADPPGLADQLHTEKLVRLPPPFLCFQSSTEEIEPMPLPALKNGFITFCSFNVSSKLNDAVLDLWGQLLLAVPGSHLLLKAPAFKDPNTRRRIEDRFEKVGVLKERLRLLERTSSYAAHMNLYGQADIALDPFPYNGTTTTCEAMWMGLPVITLAGQTHSGRVGVSILHSVGLDQFITEDFPAYIHCAKTWESDFAALSQLRSSMRVRMEKSPLMDAKRLASAIETAYRNAWVQYCDEIESISC